PRRVHAPRGVAPHGALSPRGEDRVEVRAQNQERPLRPPAPERHAVADPVDARALKPALIEPRAQGFGALALAERRRWRRTNPRVLLVELPRALLEKTEGAAHAPRRREAADDFFRRGGRGGGDGHSSRDEG